MGEMECCCFARTLLFLAAFSCTKTALAARVPRTEMEKIPSLLLSYDIFEPALMLRSPPSVVSVICLSSMHTPSLTAQFVTFNVVFLHFLEEAITRYFRAV